MKMSVRQGNRSCVDLRDLGAPAAFPRLPIGNHSGPRLGPNLLTPLISGDYSLPTVVQLHINFIDPP